MSKKKISIDDVAKRAGVSITTVSRVINHVSTVSKKNCAQVEEAVAHLNFKPNVSAQRLARGLNNAVGLVMPGYPGIFHSFYAIEIIRGVGHACETLHLDLIFHITNGYHSLNINNVGGIIFADIIENKKQIEETIAAGIPCMVINNIVDDMKVNFIAIDNIKGAEMATDYLASLGHSKIATVTGSLQTQSGLHRFEGYKKSLKKANVTFREEYVYEGDYSRRSARLGLEKFLSAGKDRPTAIFAASDDMALEIINLAMEQGLKVPKDLSVIGFDDNPIGLYSSVSLTTVRQPLFKMAEEAVRQLNAIVAGRRHSAVKQVLIPDLIVRESCSSPVV
ncbi:MAG: LacI family DNA-binding transcriptional regulator [Candidatus Omnitrophica bacterium]|nr:LacI family DNA-binding transcriptional regulator [Candidatus Omnitrophota bacterium]